MRSLIAVLLLTAASHARAEPRGFVIGDLVTLKETVIGCGWDQIKKFDALAPDVAARKTFLAVAIREGQCRVLNPGVVLYIGKHAWTSNAIEVRPQGETQPLWVVTRLLSEAGVRTGSYIK